jgi:uncharacterized protein YcnI
MKRMPRAQLAVVGVIASVIVATAPGVAFAHVTVTPSEALTGSYETFTTSVPNEKHIPVTEVRLIIPETIESVTPTVKPGWQIQTKKSNDKVTEITWTGGTIDAERRDEFTFSAHLPSVAGDITWKAYQTYQDGSVVSWDQPQTDHGHDSESEDRGPSSKTAVKDEADTPVSSRDTSVTIAPYIVSIIALVLSVFALYRTIKK